MKPSLQCLVRACDGGRTARLSNILSKYPLPRATDVSWWFMMKMWMLEVPTWVQARIARWWFHSSGSSYWGEPRFVSQWDSNDGSFVILRARKIFEHLPVYTMAHIHHLCGLENLWLCIGAQWVLSVHELKSPLSSNMETCGW